MSSTEHVLSQKALDLLTVQSSRLLRQALDLNDLLASGAVGPDRVSDLLSEVLLAAGGIQHALWLPGDQS